MQLRTAFLAADKDHGGALDLDEFTLAFGKVLGKGLNKKQLNQLFMRIDADSNGDVDWNEFMNYMLIENNTLSSMKKTFNEYVKSDLDDLSPLFTKQGHAKNITCMITLKPEDLSDISLKRE
jgi:Ca2+-binding EF-hand superfamily protein